MTDHVNASPGMVSGSLSAVTLSAQSVIDLLGLARHPTCGFVAETYRSSIRVQAYGGDRSLGSALYFLVTPEAPVVLHRIRSDQQYHHYLGDALHVLLLNPDGSASTRVVGADLAGGERPLLFIPGGTFHTARLAPGATFALLASTEWPGVEPADVEICDDERLAMLSPAQRTALVEFRACGYG